MKTNLLESISASYMTVEKIIIVFLTVFILNACSGKIQIDRLSGKANQSGNNSNVTLVNASGLIDRSLTFDSSDETNFIDYTFNCTYKATSNGPEVPCVNYGTNSPSIDSMSVHFLWDIDTSTPNGFYSFTVNKNYTDKTLTSSFVLQVNFKAPFIVKFQLNPDLLLSINVDDSYAYDFFIDWGDGSAVEHKTSGTTFSHQYTGPATTATVTITGDLQAFKVSTIAPTDRVGMIAQAAAYLGMDVPTVDAMLASYSTSDLYILLQNAGIPMSIPAFNSQVTEITQFGSLGLKKMDDLFQGQKLLTFVGPGDLSSVESMVNAFKAVGNNSAVTFNTTGWGLANVVNASSAFSIILFDNASDFSGITFSSKLQNMSSIFYASRSASMSSVASWNLSGVTNLQNAFGGATFTDFSTTNWNMQNVTNFQSAFYNLTCTNCDFSGIHVTNKAVNTVNMFEDYSGPSLLAFGSFNMSEVQNASGMFKSLDFNLFSHANALIVTNKTTDLSFMFYRTKNLVLDTSSWNTSNVVTFEGMFYAPFSNASLVNVNMSGVVVSNKATTLKEMFYYAVDPILDTSSWNTSGVIDFTKIFMNVNTMVNVDTSGVRVGTAARTINGMFAYTSNLTLNTNLPGKEWNTSMVTDMDFLFSYATCLNISSCDFSKVIPTAQTTTMINTFSGRHHQLISGIEGTSWIDDSKFPAIDTSLWNTTNVTNFYGTFARKNMAGSNLSGLSVTNKATSLRSMFDGSSNLTLDTTSWDMSNVTNADEIFSEMDASGINFAGFIPQGNISLMGAFDGVKNAVIRTSNWNLSSGANVQYLFFNGYNNKLHVDLDLANLLNSTTAFNHYGSSTAIYVLVEAGTTDPGPPTGGASYMNDTNVWCPDYAGATFMGVNCIKAPFPYP